MTLVIVEDSKLVRTQLMHLLAQRVDITVIGLAEDEDAATDMIAELQPQAVLLDLGLAKGSGLGALRRLHAMHCRSQILILTNTPDAHMRRTCEALGVAGFYDKSLEMEDCLQKLNKLVSAHATKQSR